MDGGIYLEQNGDLIEMTEHTYPAEDVLQERLAEFPRLLAGDQMTPETPRKWVLIGREAGIPDHEDGGDRWSADHLFIDQEAIPTLVEVKRSSDTRIRREVVGQALDYISHACIHWDAATLETHFEHTCDQRQRDPNDVLTELLEDESVSSFWDTAESNLRSKRVRILFVADEIPSELKRVVEFLNEGFSEVEVFAIEVSQYEGEGAKAYVPRLYGQTEEARGKKTSRYDGAINSEEAFLADVRTKEDQDDISPELAEAFLDLYAFAKELGNVKINPTKNASFKLVVDEHRGDSGSRSGVFSANVNEEIQVWPAKFPLPGEDEPSKVAWSRDIYEQYRDAFSQLDGVADETSAPIGIIETEATLKQFKSICRTFVSQCREAAEAQQSPQ